MNIRFARKLVPHEELLEFCPELLRDPEYQWMETDHHVDKRSSDKFNKHDQKQTIMHMQTMHLIQHLVTAVSGKIMSHYLKKILHECSMG